ncbi:hypothetical protein G114_17339 [Aeromonas diversa CDC 2478-85]|uniref:TPR repeat-containing protein n=1 Tax=Aeromonas diversa CDC 2478-85 TaxID=1268237 RepID=N9TWX5_9GAMM|nr:hypothetical protein [Aeromonas diversa]ENY70629.1 hypothetical protein G114_17339 [Aeromonas diversa CDC 2478-85]
MTIKQFVHDTRQQLITASADTLKTTHLYELIAAAFGYRSYAALQAEAILLHQTPWPCQPNLTLLEQRGRELALPQSQTLSLLLGQHLQRAGVASIQVEALGLLDGGEWDDDDQWEENGTDDAAENDGAHDQAPPSSTAPVDAVQELIEQLNADHQTPLALQVLQQLEAFADRGHPEVHWWLAQRLGDAEGYLDHSDEPSGYWYSKQQAGMVLSGPELEFANDFAELLQQQQRWLHHTLKAAQGGIVEARYALAEARLDSGIFDIDPATVSDPAAIAWLAMEHDNQQAAHHWLTQAAYRGDTQAMFALIEEYDRDNLYQSWVWLRLAQLLGDDFTQDDLRAIHENGDGYDDDVGGPLYVAGREGIELPPLAPELASKAEQEARGLFIQCSFEDL